MHLSFDWKTWTEKFCAATIRTYKNEPERVREDYRSENLVKDDYKGRTLLELLQNADDAQVPSPDNSARSGGKEVIFYLTPDTFYCANGGYPIGQRGLNAICRLSHSPKEDKDLFIGEKGLGFKSVLSYTAAPEIHGQSMHIRFNRNESLSFFKNAGLDPEFVSLTRNEIALFRFPFQMDTTQWETDTHLLMLSQRCTTIIKMPLQDTGYEIILEELRQLQASILLFVNHLERVTLHIIQPDLTASISTFEIDRTIPESYVLRDSNAADTRWHVFSRTISVDEQFKGHKEVETLRDVTACKIAFALQKNEVDHFIPVSYKSGNNIRVFFPTQESFPLPFLFHATYYTDSSRNRINTDYTYNQNVSSAAALVFVDDILPVLMSTDAEDPSVHMDMLFPFQSHERDNSAGGIFLHSLYEELQHKEIIPCTNGSYRKAVDTKQLPGSPETWVKWYPYLDTEALGLVDLSVSHSKRLELGKKMGLIELDHLDVLDGVCLIETGDVSYYSDFYRLVKELVASRPYEYQKQELKNKCKTMKVVLTSENRLASSEQMHLYMNPDKDNLVFPDWLIFKFIHPELVKNLGTNKDTVHTSFLDMFGIKLFTSRELMRDLFSLHIRDYWMHKKRFSEIEMLGFLSQIMDYSADELKRPENPFYLILSEVPVPALLDGQTVWVKACECYFDVNWTGEEHLQFLYHEIGHFLAPPAFFHELRLTQDILMSFLYYIGVENRPRLIEINKKQLTDSPVGNAYWRFITEKLKHLVRDDSYFWIFRFENVKAHTLDKLETILADDVKSKILLNYFSWNINFFYSLPCEMISYKSKGSSKTKYEKSFTSYLKWVFTNTDWLRDEKNKRFKPDSIFIIDTFYSRNLGEFIPRVDHRVGRNDARNNQVKSFLLQLGVKDSLNSLTLNQWHDITNGLAEKYEQRVPVPGEEADKIRNLYRDFIRRFDNVNESEEVVNNRAATKSVLAFHENRFAFYPLEEVVYADKLAGLQEWHPHVPCFQMEFSRAPKVKELFGIPALSETVIETPTIGGPANELTEMMNHFWHEAKPYLMARVQKQRTIRTDTVNVFKYTRIETVKVLSVAKRLRRPNGTEIRLPETVIDSISVKNSAHEIVIYIRAELLRSSDYRDMKNHEKVLVEIAARLSELLETDLREAFLLMLSRGTKSRINILKSNDVDHERIEECKQLLNYVEVDDSSKENEIGMDPMPPFPAPIDAGKRDIVEPADNLPTDKPQSPADVVQHVPSEQTSARLPNLDPSKTIFVEEKQDGEDRETDRIPYQNYPGEKGTGGSGLNGGGNGRAGRIQDVELRKQVEKSSMDIVMIYERDHGRFPDDSPSKARRSKTSFGPGCDIHSLSPDGTWRQIEVKASLEENETIEMTQAELDQARAFGSNYYIYRVHKLDARKYPDGPEILIYKDPYHQSKDIQTVVVRVNLNGMLHMKVQVLQKQTVSNTDVIVSQ